MYNLCCMSNLTHSTLSTHFINPSSQPTLTTHFITHPLTHSLNSPHDSPIHSVLDRWGNAVALTSTINTYFGSKVISPSTGMLFNNQMDDFSIPGASNFFGLAPSALNFPMPDKKPLSSMSPSFVLLPTQGNNGQGGVSGSI